MILPTRILRGAAALAIGLAVIGTSVSPGAAEAAVLEKKNERSADNDNDSGSGIGDVPIIGDLVGSFEGQEPEDIAVGAIQLTAGVAETVVPLVIRAFK
ncbi:MAG: hypothetical protein IT306_16295 [Chloroflexi bacterium]|nr:hypothetical protein [Chloroflexota bacterium]